MKKKLLFTGIPLISLLALVMFVYPVAAFPAPKPAALQSSLPQIVFLGEGPQTFTIDPSLLFLVKANNGPDFSFVTYQGPTYEARSQERVWSINSQPAESIRLFDEGRSYGNIEAGCAVNYVQIEDNIDDRRNVFYINNQLVQTVEQGMVTYGSFTAATSGELTFFAEDSIGLIVELCQAQVIDTVTPTVVGTTTFTLTPNVGSATPSLTSTVLTSTVTEQPQIQTVTITPQQTATTQTTVTAATPTTSGTGTATVVTTATRTATSAAVQQTATPISTPSGIPQTGGGPGIREIALTSLVLFGSAFALGGGWWWLWKKFRHGK